jgi:hypothetical protein
MNNDLLNILPDNNDGMTDQKLMDYLNGKLSGQEKYEVEKWMADNDIVGDAMEGLQNIKEKKDIQGYVDQLNKQLHLQLEKKNTRKTKRKIREYPWTYLAIILILTLCFVVYIVLRKYLMMPK